MTAENRLAAIFEQATYRVRDAEGDIDVAVGVPSPSLARLLARERVDHAVLITAHNPGGAMTPIAENAAAEAALEARIDALGLGRIPAVFGDRNGSWPDEPGWLVLGLDTIRGIALGRAFDQAAIVGIDAHGLPLLGWCDAGAIQNVE